VRNSVINILPPQFLFWGQGIDTVHKSIPSGFKIVLLYGL